MSVTPPGMPVESYKNQKLNAVHTIDVYYGNLYQHQSTQRIRGYERGEDTVWDLQFLGAGVAANADQSSAGAVAPFLCLFTDLL